MVSGGDGGCSSRPLLFQDMRRMLIGEWMAEHQTCTIDYLQDCWSARLSANNINTNKINTSQDSQSHM
jgi:hypothetical protein